MLVDERFRIVAEFQKPKAALGVVQSPTGNSDTYMRDRRHGCYVGNRRHEICTVATPALKLSAMPVFLLVEMLPPIIRFFLGKFGNILEDLGNFGKCWGNFGNFGKI